MHHRRIGGRRARARAAGLAFAAAVALGACGRTQVPANEYDPDSPPPAGAARSAPSAAPAAGPPAPGAPPQPVLTPEQDSAQEAEAFARRQESMETYESCMAKIRDVEEPVRATLVEACGRSRRRN